ncbi:MAG: hypothetical protein HOP19_13335 [Acidobacteria bacterium]|nr:hypothetical protein [Acidobacteriota bacterium]
MKPQFLKVTILFNLIVSGVLFARSTTTLPAVAAKPSATPVLAKISPTSSNSARLVAQHTGPEQDCSGGIPVCQNTYVQTQSYTGFGSVQEASNTCLITEKNSGWYIFTAQSNGSLTFTINTVNDYDFALYNISNNGCANVPNSTPIRCNYSATPGITGLQLSAQPETPAISVNSGGVPLMPAVDVTAGQTYALLVTNYTGDLNGYTLTFGGTASIFDNTPPAFKSLSLDPSQCAIELTLSEPIRCSSIAADGSDFLLTAPGGAVLTGASGIGCGTFTNHIRLTYALGNDDACGTWTLTAKTGTDGNTLIDNCQNSLANGSTLPFDTPPSAVPQLTLPGEVFCDKSAIIADGSGSTGEIRYFWSVVESDASWNVIGPECMRWFSGTANTMNVGQFAAQEGCTLQCGKYYRVKLAVQSCCTRWSETVRLIRIQCPPVADAGPDKSICCCGTQKIQIGSPAVTGVSYSWLPTIGLDNPASSNPTIDLSVFSDPSVAFPSVYEVTATDAFGCSTKDTVFIKTVCSCRPPAKVTVKQTSVCARSYTRTADCACGDATATYLWSPGGATTASIEVQSGSGPYTVTCRNECAATTSQPIVIPTASILEGGFPNIQCPNIFTPNGDGVNDLWVATDLSQSIGFTPAYNATEYQFEVYDRWGSKIVSLYGATTTGFANQTIPGWDGVANENALYNWWQHLWGRDDTYAGLPVSDGQYIYVLQMRNCTTGWTEICRGWVTVIR